MEQFPQGVYWIDLAAIQEPEAVPVAIIRTLGLRETGDLSALDDLKSQLRERTCLLVLDNFEQVTSAVGIVAELLQACPQISLLVTSRETLRLRGEKLIPLQPLGLPPPLEPGRSALPAEELKQYEAVHLFINAPRR